MIRGKTFLRLYGLADTFRAYRNAMSRRRPEGVLSQNSLGRYIRRSYVYLDVASGSALFGQLRHVAGCGEVFFASHFAPTSHRNGVALLRRLARDQACPTVLAVTADLVDMLRRCGFIVTGREIPAVFRGIPTTKILVTNISNHGYILEG